MELCLETLVDLVFKADFKPDEFEREKNVVLQEIDMSKDNLEDYIFDLYYEKTFQGHPVSRNILGTKKTLKKITRQNMIDYYQQCYQTSKMILAVTGPVEHDEVLNLIEKLGLSELKKSPPQIYLQNPSIQKLKTTGYNEWVKRPSEQAHLVVGLPSVSFLDPKRFEAYVLSSYLGGGMTSRLYQVIREQKGWAYNIYTYLQSFQEGGNLAIYIGAQPENMNSILKVLDEEFQLLLKNGISTEDLNLYKTQVKANIVMGMDDLESRMNSIGINEMIFKKYRSSDDVIQDLNKISIDSFNEMLPSSFISSELATLCLGETTGLDSKVLDEFKTYSWGF